jgi:hypothetical protein
MILLLRAKLQLRGTILTATLDFKRGIRHRWATQCRAAQ